MTRYAKILKDLTPLLVFAALAPSALAQSQGGRQSTRQPGPSRQSGGVQQSSPSSSRGSGNTSHITSNQTRADSVPAISVRDVTQKLFFEGLNKAIAVRVFSADLSIKWVVQSARGLKLRFFDLRFKLTKSDGTILSQTVTVSGDRDGVVLTVPRNEGVFVRNLDFNLSARFTVDSDRSNQLRTVKVTEKSVTFERSEFEFNRQNPLERPPL